MHHRFLPYLLAMGAAFAGHVAAANPPAPDADPGQTLYQQLATTYRACRGGDAEACHRHRQLIDDIAQQQSPQVVCDANAHFFLLGEVECRREKGAECARWSLADLGSDCEFHDERRLRAGVGLVDGKPLPTLPVMTPEASSQPVALYPLAALKNRIEGETIVRVDVSPQGRVTLVAVRKSSRDRDLDFAAMNWLRDMRFKPAALNGVPVIGRTYVPVRFVLGGREYTPGMSNNVPAIPQAGTK